MCLREHKDRLKKADENIVLQSNFGHQAGKLHKNVKGAINSSKQQVKAGAPSRLETIKLLL